MSNDVTAWLTGMNMQGYTMEGDTEIEVYGVEVVPGEGDPVRINPLDIREAADYINILEEAMNKTVTTWVKNAGNVVYDPKDDKAFNDSLLAMADILVTDALVLVQQRRKENDNAKDTKL